MRTHDGGRTVVLLEVRQDIRRETLPTLAPESTRRGGLLEVWQPGTFDATTQGSHRSEAAGNPRPAWVGTAALLRIALSRDSRAPNSPDSEGTRCSRNAARLPLVDVVEAAGLVPGGDPFFLEKQEAPR